MYDDLCAGADDAAEGRLGEADANDSASEERRAQRLAVANKRAMQTGALTGKLCVVALVRACARVRDRGAPAAVSDAPASIERRTLESSIGITLLMCTSPLHE